MPYSTLTTDYHMHSTFSPDGDHSPEMMCRQALDLGLTEIALTEHAEWHFASQIHGFPRVETYFAAIDHCRAKFEPLGLTVHAGVELGNPHLFSDQALALLAEYPFDVVVGSLHWLYDQNIHEAVCFADRQPDEVYTAYFKELAQMTMNFDFDIVAHFDRILWRGSLLGHTFDPFRLEPTIREALSTVARYGRALELNTTFITHQPSWLTALTTMFQWFREEGGRLVVVNSDAHRVTEIGRHRVLAEQILLEAGFSLPDQLFHIEPDVSEILSVNPSFGWS
ncbi:MAG: histidinol-phosphatase HisJ family protein [Anaerolineaceae bacterium]|nr:histidinol-phosphatase HisJ family protein [Anaerolineaceae bacterium]MCB9098102.1 histidinol-phosphatase HisJ family protein [Anaerolineales bacterium]